MADIVLDNGKTKKYRYLDLMKAFELSKREYFLSGLSRHNYFIDEKCDVVYMIKGKKYQIHVDNKQYIGEFSHFADYNTLVFHCQNNQTLYINQHERVRFLLYMN
jgi:hypothetical protein